MKDCQHGTGVMFSCVGTLTSIIIVASNIMFVVALVRTNKGRKFSKISILFLSQSVADLLVGCVTLPTYMLHACFIDVPFHAVWGLFAFMAISTCLTLHIAVYRYICVARSNAPSWQVYCIYLIPTITTAVVVLSMAVARLFITSTIFKAIPIVMLLSTIFVFNALLARYVLAQRKILAMVFNPQHSYQQKVTKTIIIISICLGKCFNGLRFVEQSISYFLLNAKKVSNSNVITCLLACFVLRRSKKLFIF